MSSKYPKLTEFYALVFTQTELFTTSSMLEGNQTIRTVEEKHETLTYQLSKPSP